MLVRQSLNLKQALRLLAIQKNSLNRRYNLFSHGLEDIRFLRPFSMHNKHNMVMNSNEIFLSEGPKKSYIKEQKSPDTSKMSPEEVLARLFAGLSTDIQQKCRVYKNDLIRIVNKIKEINIYSKKQNLLLIKCCTHLLPDETPASRMALLAEIWNMIRPHDMFDVDHYNELLRVYIANNRIVNANQFIQQMGSVKPNTITYELILRVLGEAGDVNQATEVISNMKAQGLPATENVFNSLIICHGKAGKLNDVNEVLNVMKLLKLEPSKDTHIAIARAYACNKKNDLLLKELAKIRTKKFKIDDIHIMEVVKTLAATENYDPVPQVLQFLPEDILKSPSISPYLQSVATLLVFQNHSMVALEIYKCLPLPSFGPKDDRGLHGRSLVRDCVKASIPSSVIALLTQELMASGRNPIAIQNATEAALQLGKVPLALDFFTRMKQMGMPLREHYFWPILLRTSLTYGEKGVMNTLSTMVTMDVKPDYDTLMQYTLPYVSFTSPQNLMKKFLEAGLTVTTVLTPIMVTLLITGQVRAASEICELFQGKVDVEKILKPLIKGFLISSDLKSTVFILEDITDKALDKNKDWVGRFLCEFVRHDKVKSDLSDLLSIAKALPPTKIRISTAAADYCMTRLPVNVNDDTKDAFKEALIQITDEGMRDDAELYTPLMPHPKQMNEGSLQAHLRELEAKNMNTRGVLRKLLQQYCREGNLAAAKEIVEKCQKEEVFLSAGMKASIFDLHVKLGELDLAEVVLADLNKSSPNFTLDEFKVINFATLMVYRKEIDKAFNLIKEQSKSRRVMGGRNVELNCWRLLDAVAAHGSPDEVQRMLDLLTELRYCRPNNTLLGPLIRVHLKTNNIQQAVEEFVKLANKYNKTPLKHELLCKILGTMGEGKSEDIFLVNEKNKGKWNHHVQSLLNIVKKVHGPGDVQLTMVAALAEVGYKKTLRKLFLDPTFKFHPEALMRHCERFADEKKVDALEAIAECAKDIRQVNTEDIYNMMLDVYQREDNCQEGLSIWYKLQEADVTPSQKFVSKLCSMCKSNNKQIPADLALLLDKQARKVTN